MRGVTNDKDKTLKIETITPILVLRVKDYTYWFCKVGQNKTRGVAPSRSRRDHRKSKFGVRQGIKLNELYALTNSEFWCWIAWLRRRGGNVPNLDPWRVNCQFREGAPRARDAWNLFRKFTKSRAPAPRGRHAPVSSRSSLQYVSLFAFIGIYTLRCCLLCSVSLFAFTH